VAYVDNEEDDDCDAKSVDNQREQSDSLINEDECLPLEHHTSE
jgi:hypothetical protein